MTLDTDGKIRMDCSSPNAMASLIANRDAYQIATGKRRRLRPARHRHPRRRAAQPEPLPRSGDRLPVHAPVGVGGRHGGRQDRGEFASIIDRVVAGLGRTLVEVPVGFKWFVDGLVGGSIGFGGEESAGASFLRKDGSVWTTDKDGIILALLASEMLAVTGSTTVAAFIAKLSEKYGAPTYARIDCPRQPGAEVRGWASCHPNR